MNVALPKKYDYSLILLRELVITDFKLRYQGSVLGYMWSLMRPLFLFVIMYVVFVYFLKVGEGEAHWPIQLLIGIILWSFFSEVTNNGVGAVVGRGDVIRKINFPKYVIVLSTTISALINLAINLIIVLIFMFISGVTLHWGMLMVPLYLAELMAFSLGIAFLLSAIFVRLRDINYIWEIIMQGLFYASIVIYPVTMILDKNVLYAQILLLNPVAQVIQDTRHYLVSADAQTLFSISGDALLTCIPIVISFGMLCLGAYVFRKRSPVFAEEV